ncbi:MULTISPECIES: LysE family translocator [unclassified Rhizobium]|jgi:threonine/homoserine/homoserine lactone efflux protein|uniref:LysE family translocator n=1 Tax=unclassified Rhizobium TaxID=2613769 RepID=UPI00037004E4|nr:MULTISPECIES: LysE family translocator [unclassified Rhizobium]MBD9446956.1 LysE family translocator [Rhizobium sp. RHZ01]MBD9452183.1 LysE family translocator [Rhizobium sp. RHZ02]NMN72381.1 threonine/homoserine/homoserine lactone efflux protein [Rhizobium sp. 57MFTsu3.2]
MTYSENLWLYFTLLFGIIIVPGMDMLFVLANSLSGGRRTGIAATAGIVAGGAVHSLYGAIGVGVLAVLLPTLFNPLLFAGAAYMAWIGFTLIRSSITVETVGAGGLGSGWRAFRQGAATCLMNPKAYLFMIAVYPQFLKPIYGPIWAQGLVMGFMTMATQAAVYGTLALTAARSRTLLVSNPKATILVGRVAGALLIAVSILTAWHGWRVSV